VAAPAWGAIANETLRQLGVMPASAREAATVAVAGLTPSGVNLSGVNLLALSEENPSGMKGSALKLPSGSSVVPDLSGLPARSAVRRLAELSLEPELRGSGRAVAQSPRAGSVVKRGARVRVTLAPPG
jgi:hypothetical protein